MGKVICVVQNNYQALVHIIALFLNHFILWKCVDCQIMIYKLLFDVAVKQSVNETSVNIGQYASCTYDFDWYSGIIYEKNKKKKGAKIQFMILIKCTKSLSWSPHQQTWWLLFHDIICSISVLNKHSSSGRHY